MDKENWNDDDQQRLIRIRSLREQGDRLRRKGSVIRLDFERFCNAILYFTISGVHEEQNLRIADLERAKRQMKVDLENKKAAYFAEMKRRDPNSPN
jgi:hypothetical protein